MDVKRLWETEGTWDFGKKPEYWREPTHALNKLYTKAPARWLLAVRQEC